jgi:hypothetical protein
VKKSASSDGANLAHFGYVQELSMGGFLNFAVAFSVISILTSAVRLYGYGRLAGRDRLHARRSREHG